jgi:hypothetical protein
MNRDASSNVITSVIGFNLKDTVTEVIDENGEVKLLKGGIRSTVSEHEPQPIMHKECNTKWFTTFNQRLLDKIRDHKYNNL